MAKLLRVKDYVLLAAALAGDTLEGIRLVGGIVPGLMEARYGFVPPNYKKSGYLSAVSKLLSTGEIKKTINSRREVVLELTSSGKERFKRKFPVLSLQKGKWDKTLMLVAFDIVEKKRGARDLLRRKLRELGFGMMQKSVWVSPYHFEDDFREFGETRNLEKDLYVLKAHAPTVGDVKAFGERVWRLKRINQDYSEILVEIGVLANSGKSVRKRIMKKLWEKYFRVLLIDPLLPKEFLPDDWSREKVASALQKLALPKM